MLLHQRLVLFQTFKSCIPSHMVCATNMERIVNRAWHPTAEEIEQDEIHREEMKIKELLAEQEMVVT